MSKTNGRVISIANVFCTIAIACSLVSLAKYLSGGIPQPLIGGTRSSLAGFFLYSQVVREVHLVGNPPMWATVPVLRQLFLDPSFAAQVALTISVLALIVLDFMKRHDEKSSMFNASK